MTPIRVVVCDDHPMARLAHRVLIGGEPDMDLVGEAEDGESAVVLVRRERPDVILMDVRLPALDGIEATRRVAGAGHTKVLLLTTYDTDDYLWRGLAAGASGFVVKDCGPEQLLQGIRAVAAGHDFLAPSVTRRVVERALPRVGRSSASPPLSTQESALLRHVSTGATNAEIARVLLLSPATVKTYVSRLAVRLGAPTRARLVALAHEYELTRADDGPA
ncbi:MAG: response regulator transcription factor [Dermatophilaceae bacterium]